MPTDLSPHTKQGTVQVYDRAGIGLPFSKGLLATSILATGLENEVAYHVASEVETDLRSKGMREIEADRLVNLATAIIKSEAGPHIAERYLAWRQVKRAGRPIYVVLGGAPGIGKSTVATRLAVRLGITRVITTDTIREVLRSVVAEAVLPELHVSSYEKPNLNAGGNQSSVASFHRQAIAVGSATAAVAKRLAAENRSAIIEGIHMLPGIMTKGLCNSTTDPVVVEILLTLEDSNLHKSHLTCRLDGEPARAGDRHLKHFATIRQLQTTLRQMAHKSNVAEYDVADPEDLTSKIVDRILSQMHSNESSNSAK